ncbi:MAG: NYN domain-containing protein [Candidatus Aceula meridiana]|nr:NYN domain-containing protein [Candidatus Aceula meridiana]
MSLHYILDGYNVLNKLPRLIQKSLKDAREGLVQVLEVDRPQGSIKNKVTIVFDGQPGMLSGMKTNSVFVIFTENQTADDRIKRIVDNAANPRNIVVVTEDREIQIYVKKLGARVLAVKGFFEKIKKKQGFQASLKRKRGLGEIQRVSKSAEYKINNELTEAWLKDK